MKNEDEKLREAARMLSRNCEERLDSCKGCLFCRDNLSCKINGIPQTWDSDFGDDHSVDVRRKVWHAAGGKKYGTPTDTPTETDTPTDAPTASGKTRQERLLEMFPHAVVRNGVLAICPGNVDERLVCNEQDSCRDCRKEYWLAAEKEEKS
jgi:hypothetical protein